VDDIQLTIVDAGSPEAQWAMTQYFAELAARFPEGFDATGALEGAASAYNPPHGVFLLASSNGETVGCGGLQHIDGHTAEVKRMWVSPTMRGRGLATRLLHRLEDEGRAAGRSTVVLDTHSSLTEAITLYERRGYVATERYNDNPYAKRWFRKSLDPQ
jgi:GNAT superfamily N-acetyltransferase